MARRLLRNPWTTSVVLQEIGVPIRLSVIVVNRVLKFYIIRNHKKVLESTMIIGKVKEKRPPGLTPMRFPLKKKKWKQK